MAIATEGHAEGSYQQPTSTFSGFRANRALVCINQRACFQLSRNARMASEATLTCPCR